MPYSVTKIPDGDVNLGNLNGEFVVLAPSDSLYVTGGYALVADVDVVDNPSLDANIDLYRLIATLPVGDAGGYVLQQVSGSPNKVAVYQQNATTGALQEVPSNTNLAAYSFLLLLLGL